jgi:hypothetical protein
MNLIPFISAGARFETNTITNPFFTAKLVKSCRRLSLTLLALFILPYSYAQFYERTNQNFGVYFTGAPVNYFSASKINQTQNFGGIQAGIQRMFYPGISASFGYSYSQAMSKNSLTEIAFPFNQAHILHSGIMFDKRLAKFKDKRYRNICHYLVIGLIGSIDYAFMLPQSNFRNESFGELSGTLGFSMYKFVSNMSKRNQSWTIHSDFFYRYGATPIANYELNNEMIRLKRQEVGIRLRIYKHKVYDFLK